MGGDSTLLQKDYCHPMPYLMSDVLLIIKQLVLLKTNNILIKNHIIMY